MNDNALLVYRTESEKEKLNCNIEILKERGVKDFKFFRTDKPIHQTDEEYKLAMMQDINVCIEAILNKRYKQFDGIGDSVRNIQELFVSKLYIAIFNDVKNMDSYLPFCSTDYNLIKDKCEEWIQYNENNKLFGSYAIQQLIIDEDVYQYLNESANFIEFDLFFTAAINEDYDITNIIDFCSRKDYVKNHINNFTNSYVNYFKCEFIK